MASKGHEVSQSRATISQIDYIDSLRYETGETGPSVADLDVQSASVEIDRLLAIKNREINEIHSASVKAETERKRRVEEARAAAQAQNKADLENPAFHAWAAEVKGVPFEEINRIALRALVGRWRREVVEAPVVEETTEEIAPAETSATETPARCTATTRRGTQCSRKARHGEHCTQHAAMAEASAQDSETITLEDLAAEHSYTVEGLAALLGDTSLTAHDGVDADAARRLISTHMLVPGQIWESKNYGTDHTVTEHVGDDLWAITGPTGNVYVTTPQTFRALNRLTGRTQVR